MKKLVALGIFLALMPLLYGQIITVVDLANSEPLDVVSILSDNPRAMALTNSKGQADIKSFETSNRIEIRLLGYRAIYKTYSELASGDRILKLQGQNVDLQQVVVSATKWAQSNRESPEKITTITPKDVALYSPATTADLLGTGGDVFIQKSQLGGGSPMIRGFATNRLLYTVDGVRMNTAIFRGGNIQNVISLDPFAIERTEIMFGSGSVIYGSDAIGAVMNFSTLAAQFSLSDQVSATGLAMGRYASASNERTAHFHAKVGWNKWALVSSFSSFDYGDLRMGRNGRDSYLRPWYSARIDSTDIAVANEDPTLQVGTGYEQQNFMQKVAFRPNDVLQLTYAFHYSATGDVPRYDRLIETSGGLPRSAVWYYGPQIWRMNHLEVKYEKATALFDAFKIQLAEQFFEESRNDRRFNRVGLRQQNEKVNAYSANLDFAKYFANKSRIFYGAEWVLNQVESAATTTDISTGITEISEQRYPQSDWNSYGVYALYQRDLSEKAVLQAGARYNAYSLESDFSNNLDFVPLPVATANLNNGALTGSLGITYRPSDTWWLSANFSTAFRAPNVDDIGKIFEGIDNSITVPNTNLEAEYAYNSELSIGKILSDKVKVNLTGYYTLLDNALVRRPFLLNGTDSVTVDGDRLAVLAIQNGAQATVYGIQAGLEIKLPQGFSIGAKYNFQKGEEELDNGDKTPSRHAAPMFGRVNVQYAQGKLTMQAYVDYSGEFSHDELAFDEAGKRFIYANDQNGETFSPAWYTVNIKALIRLNDVFLISAGMENIADTRYRPYSSGLIAAGRNVTVSLTARF